MDQDTLNAFVPGHDVHVPGALGGPLAGLTFAAKDLFDVAGVVTGGGTPDWGATHPVPDRHAWTVQALLDAGASLVGKTVSCEISLGILGFHRFFPTPVNPRAPGCMPGGSSSGSAAAVAGGLIDTALGTDSGGSVRVPASLCGLYGLRPTLGRVPFDGVCVQSPSFDTAGWFARDGETFARVAEALLQTTIGEPTPTPLLVADDAFATADPGVAEALRPGVERVAALLGGEVRRVSLAEGELAIWAEQRNVLQRSETWRTFKDWIDEHNPRFAFNVARNLAAAAAITQAQVDVATVVRRRATERVRMLLEEGAILCFPTTPYTAPPVDLPLHQLDALSARLMSLNSVAGLASIPQLSLPVGELNGKPIGLSILAWRGGEEQLVAIARHLRS